jgi:DHA2 family methylenomycin A resistance protein-like MFS transporter
MAVLVAGRALQGVGAALVLPGSLALLTSAITAEQARARVVGIWVAVGGMALPAGLLAGGLLVQAAGWRAVFWPSVPVIVLGILTPAIVTAALRAVPDAAGVASGASNTARQIGAALGVAAFGTIAASTAATAFASRSAWLLAGSALLFTAAAAFCLALHHCAWWRR